MQVVRCFKLCYMCRQSYTLQIDLPQTRHVWWRAKRLNLSLCSVIQHAATCSIRHARTHIHKHTLHCAQKHAQFMSFRQTEFHAHTAPLRTEREENLCLIIATSLVTEHWLWWLRKNILKLATVKPSNTIINSKFTSNTTLRCCALWATKGKSINKVYMYK